MKSTGATVVRKTKPSDSVVLVHARRQIYVWSRLLLQLGAGLENRRHRHFGAFLLIAPDAPIEVTVEQQGRILSQAVLVAPNTWHRLDSRGSRVATLVVGPDHPWFGYVTSALNGSVAVPFELSKLVGNHVDWDHLFSGEHDCAAVQQFIERVLAAMTNNGFTPHQLDPKIAAVVDALNRDDAHVISPAISPAELARCVRLSAFTLMRRFKREMGVRIREYVLWRRLINAIPLLGGKRTLTEVAHLAGFYDQSHLTRTSRRMFDLQPSSVVGSHSARIHVCSRPAPR